MLQICLALSFLSSGYPAVAIGLDAKEAGRIEAFPVPKLNSAMFDTGRIGAHPVVKVTSADPDPGRFAVRPVQKLSTASRHDPHHESTLNSRSVAPIRAAERAAPTGTHGHAAPDTFPEPRSPKVCSHRAQAPPAGSREAGPPCHDFQALVPVSCLSHSSDQDGLPVLSFAPVSG